MAPPVDVGRARRRLESDGMRPEGTALSDNSANSFSAACGAGGPLVLAIQEPGRPASDRRSFDQPFLVVGCHFEADLPVIFGEVSRRHCYFQTIAGRVFCLDLGSRWGTYLDGDRLTSFWVRPFQQVRVGPVVIQLEPLDRRAERLDTGPDDALSPLSLRYAQKHPLPDASLEFGIAGKKGRPHVWQVSRSLSLVGSSPACQVRLNHPSIADFHCSLLLTERGVWVVDLLSVGGIEVNGTSTRFASLADGDELRVGCFTARLRREPVSNRFSSSVALVHAESSTLEFPRSESRTASALASRPASTSLKVATEIRTAEPFTTSPIDHVASMRTQTADPLPQALMMMAQMFGSMHREQMDQIKSDLGQIRQLNQEIQALRGHGVAVSPSLVETPLSGSASPEAGSLESSLASHQVAGPSNGFSNFDVRSAIPARNNGAIAPPLDSTTSFPGQEAVPERVRDPQVVVALVGERLSTYERERQSAWGQIARIVETLQSPSPKTAARQTP